VVLVLELRSFAFRTDASGIPEPSPKAHHLPDALLSRRVTKLYPQHFNLAFSFVWLGEIFFLFSHSVIVYQAYVHVQNKIGDSVHLFSLPSSLEISKLSSLI